MRSIGKAGSQQTPSRTRAACQHHVTSATETGGLVCHPNGRHHTYQRRNLTPGSKISTPNGAGIGESGQCRGSTVTFASKPCPRPHEMTQPAWLRLRARRHRAITATFCSSGCPKLSNTTCLVCRETRRRRLQSAFVVHCLEEAWILDAGRQPRPSLMGF
jgi:hypothetical protein